MSSVSRSHPGCLVKQLPLSVEPLKLSPVGGAGGHQGLQCCEVGLIVLQVLLDQLRTHSMRHFTIRLKSKFIDLWAAEFG